MLDPASMDVGEQSTEIGVTTHSHLRILEEVLATVVARHHHGAS